MKNARLHVLDVQAELAEGHVNIDGNTGLVDRPVTESARQVALEHAGDYYDQSEMSVRALIAMFGDIRVPAEPRREIFAEGFADGVGRFVLADCRLNNRVDVEEEPISTTQPVTFTHYMFMQYLGFNKRLGQNGLTKDLFRRNPFTRHSTSLYDELLDVYGDELNEYIVRKTFRNLHSNPGQHLEKVKEAYYDISEVFPETPSHALKMIAFRYPEQTVDKTEEMLQTVSKLRAAFPDIATHVVEHAVFNSNNPKNKLKVLRQQTVRIVASHPKMPLYVAQEIAIKHPKQVTRVAEQLETAVEIIVEQYPVVRRGRAYHIGSWYGTEELAVAIPRLVELSAEYAVRSGLSHRKLCEVALQSPNAAEVCIRAYIDGVTKRKK